MKPHRIHALAIAALLLSSACGDITSGSPRESDAKGARPRVTRQLGTVTCYVDVAAGTHRCGDLVTPGGGMQTRVALNTSHFTLVTGTSFTSGGIGYFFNKIQNDIGQDIGTHDGIFSDSIRAFVTAINVTGGSGTVTPRNHTGTGTFTAAGQPYWLYEEIVSPSTQSSMFIWEFNVPDTVTAWNYTVGVSAPIAHPNGWVDVTGDPQIPNGGSRTHTAVVHDWIGNVVTSGYVLWSRTNVSGSVTFTVPNSRQAIFTGTSVGTVEIWAYHGSATEDVNGAEVY